MKSQTLKANKDPMGTAIKEFQETGKASKLRVLSTMFDEDEIEVEHLFRTYRQMPPLEQMALRESRGRVLDVGAGSGCHSLALQNEDELKGKIASITAIDISPLSCQVMRERGLADVRCQNFFDEEFADTFDTILLLMNGTGIAGKKRNMQNLLLKAKKQLNTDGQILIDSSDLRYLYEDENGEPDFDGVEGYYGEVDYKMKYRNVSGDKFDWLYLDQASLKEESQKAGLTVQILAEGENYDYLALLRKV